MTNENIYVAIVGLFEAIQVITALFQRERENA